MKLLIAACPEFTDYQFLCEEVDYLLSNTTSPVTIHTCVGRGSDRLGERYARDRGYEIRRFYADYERWSGGAGWTQLNDALRASDAVVGFYVNKTQRLYELLDYAECLNKKVAEYKYKEKKDVK